MIISLIFNFILAIFVILALRERYIKHKLIAKHAHHYQDNASLLTLVYTDKFGNNWYRYTDFLKLPPKRAIEAEIATRHADICLTPKSIDEFLGEMERFINLNKLTKVAALVESMKQRRTMAAEENTLSNLANCYFMLEGEDPVETTEFWYAKKKEIWSMDKAAYGFFLRSAFATMRDIKNLSDTDLLQYLKDKAQEEVLLTAL